MNSLGQLFRVTSFGESHGPGIGAVIDGCPAGLPLDIAAVQAAVDRRKPDPGHGGTPRVEADRVEVLSGLYREHTTGAPLCLWVRNTNIDSGAYEKTAGLPRPGHADYTAFCKYGGWNDVRGGGRFSGRVTVAYVMAGAVAQQLLVGLGVTVTAHVTAIGTVKATPQDPTRIKVQAEGDPLRCADPEASASMARLIEEVRQSGDSVGGIVEGIAFNLPAGLGEPVIDTLEGDVAKALFAIPAVKAVEFGEGFAAAAKRGSENNDAFRVRDGRVVTATNHAGGILGGLSSGMPLIVRAAVKPTPSLPRPQDTVDLNNMTDTSLSVTGRHDICIVPRAVPVVEAMIAIVLCDFALRAGVLPRVLKRRD
jgi:chorismate synthase